MTVFDALLLAIVGVSVFFAAYRGAIRELATVGALILAGLAGWFGMKPVAAMIGADSFFTSAAAAMAIGLFVFLGVYFILHRLMARMKLGKRMKRYDGIGGGVFGLVRALALIGLGFLGYGYYLEEANQPDAVRNAMLLPVATGAAGFFEQFAPSNRELNASGAIRNAAQEGYEGRDRSGLREIVTTVTTTEQPERAPADDPIADILTQEPTSDGEPDGR